MLDVSFYKVKCSQTDLNDFFDCFHPSYFSGIPHWRLTRFSLLLVNILTLLFTLRHFVKFEIFTPWDYFDDKNQLIGHWLKIRNRTFLMLSAPAWTLSLSWISFIPLLPKTFLMIRSIQKFHVHSFSKSYTNIGDK